MNKNEIKTYLIKLAFTIGVIAITSIFILCIIYSESLGNIFNNILDILFPFIIGGCIAYLLAPLCNKIENKLNKVKYSKAISIVLSEVMLIIIIGILCIIILPQSINSIANILNSMPKAYENTVNWLDKTLENHEWIQNILKIEKLDIETIMINFIDKTIMPNINSIFTSIASGATSIFNVLFNLIIGLIVNIFALANRKIFAKQAKKIIYALLGKNTSKLVIEEVSIANKMFSGFIVGKIIDSIIIGLICFILMLILRIPYALLVSVIVGITNIIPFFGPFIGAVPSTIIIFSYSPIKSLYFLILIIVLQQIDGNIIGPKCIGNATNLNTFWVLFAILFFGGLWGIVGMLIGVPLLAVVFDIGNKVINYLLNKKNIVSEEIE